LARNRPKAVLNHPEGLAGISEEEKPPNSLEVSVRSRLRRLMAALRMPSGGPGGMVIPMKPRTPS